MPAPEFMRRFLLHVLPKGFAKIRHYGLLANRSAKLERCKRLLGVETASVSASGAATAQVSAEEPRPCCPSCRSTRLRRREIPAVHRAVEPLAAPPGLDTS